MKEEKIKEIAEKHGHNMTGFYGRVSDVENAIREALESQWISVEDEPIDFTKHKEVLVKTEHGFYFAYAHSNMDDVTHWMPIPKLNSKA